jgi:two-component system, chemotaxis family, response regulator Rcp1
MSDPSSAPIARILLVEDNPADAELTRIALRKGKLKVDLDHVVDGVEALAFLRKQGDYEDALTPDLVLLDLNLPRKSGHEVLAEVRTDPALEHMPVVILTTSETEEDILESYRSKANCYVTKPLEAASFQQIVGAVEEFWFTIVKLPKA